MRKLIEAKLVSADGVVADPQVWAMKYRDEEVDAVGAERILLGTDHPLLEVPRYLRAFDQAGLGEAERALVTGGNAARILHL